MNKTELKEMLEFAGVDISKGKAKSLIEAASDTVTCPECHGKGMTRQSHQGEMEWDHCPTCDGKKTISRKEAELDEGWGAAGQKRQQDAMSEESEKYRKQIQDKNPDALKAYDAWRAVGVRGSAAAKKAVEKGMPLK